MDLGLRVANTRPHAWAFPTDVTGPQVYSVYLFAPHEKYSWQNLKREVIQNKEIIRNIAKTIEERYNVKLDLEGLKGPLEKAFDMISSAFISTRNIRFLTRYQYEAILKILRNDKRGYVISSPTGSGKTLIFTFVALFYLCVVKLLEKDKKIESKKGVKILIIYPRKSLESDQMRTLLALLYEINEKLEGLSLAIDDGETWSITWRLRNIREPTSFRGITCPFCNSRLIVHPKDEILRCESGEHEFKFVKVSRKDIEEEVPDILITNVWTYYLRFTRINGRSNYWKSGYLNEDLFWLILDECHAYKGPQLLLAGAVFTTIMHYQAVHCKALFSSATIPKKAINDFLMAIAGLRRNEWALIDHDEMIKKVMENKKGTFELFDEITEQVRVYFYVANPQIGWETLSSEAFATYLMASYAIRKHTEDRIKISAIAFIDSVRDLNRIKSITRKAIELGSPWDKVIASSDFGKEERLDIYGEILKKKDRQYPSKQNKKRFIERYYKELVNLMGEHYGEYIGREEIEKALKSGELALVFSTSTLELGIDYDNVSFIFMIGKPIGGKDSLEQRVGRAGRDPKSTLRTTVIVLFLKNKPSDYRFYMRLRHEKDILEEIYVKELVEYFKEAQIEEKDIERKLKELEDWNALILPSKIAQKIKENKTLNGEEIKSIKTALEFLVEPSYIPVGNVLLQIFRVCYGFLVVSTRRLSESLKDPSKRELIRSLDDIFEKYKKKELSSTLLQYFSRLSLDMELNHYLKNLEKVYQQLRRAYDLFEDYLEDEDQMLRLEEKVSRMDRGTIVLRELFSRLKKDIEGINELYESLINEKKILKAIEGNKELKRHSDEILESLSRAQSIISKIEQEMSNLIALVSPFLKYNLKSIVKAEISTGVMQIVRGKIKKITERVRELEEIFHYLSQFSEGIRELEAHLSNDARFNKIKVLGKRIRGILDSFGEELQEVPVQLFKRKITVAERILIKVLSRENSTIYGKKDALIRLLEGTFGVSFLGLEIAQKSAVLKTPTRSPKRYETYIGTDPIPVEILIRRYPPFEPIKHPKDTENAPLIERTGFWIINDPSVSIAGVISPYKSYKGDQAFNYLKHLRMSADVSLHDLLLEEYEKTERVIYLIPFIGPNIDLSKENVLKEKRHFVVIKLSVLDEFGKFKSFYIAYPLIYEYYRYGHPLNNKRRGQFWRRSKGGDKNR